MVRHLTKISDLTQKEFYEILTLAVDMKKSPEKYRHEMDSKTLLMLFEKPSLRTRVSFETGMTQMGGHAIFYSIADSPMGRKESVADTVRCLERFVNVIMARVNKRKDIREMASISRIPIINALDDFAHPCQMIADIMCIGEKKGFDKFSSLRLAYCGDCRNNVTNDLLRAGLLCGMTVAVAGPQGPGYDMEPEVLAECEALAAKYGGKFEVHHDAAAAVKDADAVYTDSWMSYHIPEDQEEARRQKFLPFQVNVELLKNAKPDVIFMNCLPASRKNEQTPEVIDGPHSVVFDEAENRLHGQKALLKWLLDDLKKAGQRVV